jgi:hypothetical protein
MVGQNLRIVRLTWIDPTSIDAWTSKEEAIAYEPHKIITVGILVGETEGYYIVAANMDLVNDDVSCVMVIPRSALLKPLEVINEREDAS